MNSILDSIKTLLGIRSDDDSFDKDIIFHINTAFYNLVQIGVGDDFSIIDNTAIWTDFLKTSKELEAVKSYVYLKVRLLFDPPTSSVLLDSIKSSLLEYECRLNYSVDK